MRFFIIPLLLLGIIPIKAQNYIGLYTSNFAGVSGMQFNPANSAHNYLRFDVNFLSGGAYVYNEYMYVVNATTGSLLSAKKRAPYDELLGGVDSGFAIYDFFNNYGSFNNLLNVKVGGPGFMMKKKRVGFGVFSNFVFNGSATDVDKIINYDTLTQLNHYQAYDIDRMEFNIMSYIELGANFSYNFLIKPDNQLSVGINVKTLLGIEGEYLKNLRPTKFKKSNDSTWIQGGDMEFGYSTNMSERGFRYSPAINGLGFSFDIGAEYVKNDQDGNILFKGGVVIKDLGFINYTSNASANRITTDNTVDWYNNALKQIVSPQTGAKQISYQSLGDSAASQIGTTISMQTPAALNLYGEYAFNEKYKIHFMVQRRLNLFEHQSLSSNIISVTPRYETRWIEVGAPINFVEDAWLGLGLYARFGFITIGSDHINTWIIPQAEYKGSDVYFSLRFNPWKEKEARRKRSRDYGCFYKMSR